MVKSLLTNRRYLKRGVGDWFLHRSHALLGALVMSHLIYRYTCFFAVLWLSFNPQDTSLGVHHDMGFDGDAARVLSWQQQDKNFWVCWQPMVLLLFPHLLLQISGFGFRIPPKRHPEGNRIWGEYRWHALAFFTRCGSLLSLAWYNKTHPDKEDERQRFIHTQIVAAGIFFANMMVVDAMTRNFAKKPKSYFTKTTNEEEPEQVVGTIRGLKGSNGFKYLLSATQFHANLHCLCTQDQLSVQWAALTVVQSSAFGMTLRRKSLITHGLGLVLYASVLALGMVVIGYDWYRRGLLYTSLAVGNLAAIMRMDGGCNKYILWLVIAGVVVPQMEQQHQRLQQDGERNTPLVVFVASTIIMGMSAIYRHHEQQQKQEDKQHAATTKQS
mmetsp:Transcript_1061/g.2390  ORF Transcript_1061/g.2390 Transcript_1061/m.2390 type:complete len:384 (-) Transcript_1061:1126-2277(-)